MRRMLFLAPLVLALAACGGSSGSTSGGNVAAGPAGDPVAAVNNYVTAIKSKAFDKLGPLVCAAKRYAIVGTYTGSGMPAALLDAMTFDVQNLNVQQSSVTGDAAVVHVTGKLVSTVDAGKAKDAVKALLGNTATDDQINQMITGLSSSKDISQDVDVVKENGGWVVCSDLGSTTGG